MSISYQVLGRPGGDNAVFVRVETGQAIRRFLFDCGDGCLVGPVLGELLTLDGLLFSHLHMDHIAGFDRLFRRTYNRAHAPMEVWGPPETARIMHCRFQGFMWNLFQGQAGTWYVVDVAPDQISRQRFEAAEAFALAHAAGSRPFDGTLIATDELTITALHMD